MRLLIVESPNKIKKLRQYVGDDFRLAASMGHVRDLPPRGGLAVDFTATGEVIPHWCASERGADTIANLQRQAAGCDEVWLAMDPDREGEAIAWHLAAVLDLPCQRVAFRAITAKAVQDALASPRAIDQDLVDAQQARRVLDRVVGWTVSPALQRGLQDKQARSAGRVQSAALRLVVEREEAIAAHDSVQFHQLLAELSPTDDEKSTFSAECVRWKGAALEKRLVDAATAKKTAAWCQRQPWTILSLQQQERRRAPPPPFTTATVQQAASVRLKFDPEQTMKLLQQLFEAGLITYHRTDSTALAPEAIALAREEVIRRYGADAVPAEGRTYAVHDPRAQEAHEAIRPADLTAKPPAGDPAKLYRLIGERFLACQMNDYREAVTTVRLACGPVDGWLAKGASEPEPIGVFHAVGRQELDPGWRALGRDATEEGKEAKAQRLPALTEATAVSCHQVTAKKSKTKPPPRFTAASLIKALERSGVGRPSTYAAIIRLLHDRGYMSANKRRQLQAEALGMKIVGWLRNHFRGDFIDIDYTSRMESTLDAIAGGQQPWQTVVSTARQAVVDLAKRSGLRYDPTEPLPEGPACPLCASPMQTRTSMHGIFFVCSAVNCDGLCDSNGQPNRRTQERLQQRQREQNAAPSAEDTPGSDPEADLPPSNEAGDS